VKFGKHVLAAFPCPAAAAAALEDRLLPSEDPAEERAVAAASAEQPQDSSEPPHDAAASALSDEQLAASISSLQLAPEAPAIASALNFEVEDAGDHAETPIEAYMHIVPLLSRLCRCFIPWLLLQLP
jgi:hypothetical protein